MQIKPVPLHPLMVLKPIHHSPRLAPIRCCGQIPASIEEADACPVKPARDAVRALTAGPEAGFGSIAATSLRQLLPRRASGRIRVNGTVRPCGRSGGADPGTPLQEDAAMRKCHVVAIAAAIAAASIGGLGVPGTRHAASAAEPLASYREDVLPIFVGRCVSCHAAPNGEGYKASGLDLTSYKGVMAGTKFGPMVIPGNPDSSNIMRLLDWQASPQLRMPHGKKQLSVCDRDAIRTWIRQGAKDN